MNDLYPAFIKLEGKRCTVVGGGKVAYRKICSLLESGGVVTLISPELCEELGGLVKEGKVHHKNREYKKGDLRGCFMVIAATDDYRVNQLISQEAEEQGVLVNIVDNPELCNFYVPATYTQGDLKIAISTNGKAPFLAKIIRQELASRYGEEFSQYLDEISRLRRQILEKYPDDSNKRRQLLMELSKTMSSRQLDEEEEAGIF